ncbi:imelysin family protein [Tenacibaculum sp. UWU-22]|uniref:imelysin family protein n=1 Tax=Tenacibaculum sp. UWU-22 TaxID=3234187 RepID=UPI0034DB2E3A
MKKIKNIAIVVFIISILFTSCSDDDAPVIQTDYSKYLSSITLNVILKNYENLALASTNMVVKSDALTIGDDTALKEAQDAWRKMRVYWENSEAVLFGPAGDEGLGVDGNTDAWPIDLAFVNNVLGGSDQITINFIAQQDANAKGYHALEYLLWGIEGNKKASDLTAREIEYVKAASGYLNQQTKALYDAWNPSKTNFAANFTNAENGLYRSQIAALIQLVDGMITIADEVGNGKLNEPMYGNNGSFALESEESRFSHNSKADFADNIRGIKYMYSGDYLTNLGVGFSELVAINNSALDTKIKNQIDQAIQSIEAIPGTFTSAVQNHRSEVEKAIKEVLDVFNVLSSELKPYIQNL